MLVKFVATATTCAVSPGREEIDDAGVLHIADRTFSDIVECEDDRIAGTNEPKLSIDVDTKSGEAVLRGRFTLAPKAVGGSWEGELQGRIANGLVTATGLARGVGELAGAALQVDFRQVQQLAKPAPCADPKAFFEMEGWILEGK